MKEFLRTFQISKIDFEKLRHYARCNWRVTVSWWDSPDLYFAIYFRQSSHGILLSYRGLRDMILLMDVLNRYGERAWRENAGVVDWSVSSRVLLTAIRVLEKRREILEEITKTADTPEQFLALVALV